MSSWVIIRKSTGAPVLETWSRKVVGSINTKAYKAVPILTYLQELNGRVSREHGTFTARRSNPMTKAERRAANKKKFREKETERVSGLNARVERLTASLEAGREAEMQYKIRKTGRTRESLLEEKERRLAWQRYIDRLQEQGPPPGWRP